MGISPKLLNEGEYVVVSTRTHPKVLIGPILVLLLCAAVAVGITTFGTGTAGLVLHAVVWALALAVAVWFGIRPILIWATTTYTFTNRRFMKRSGVLAKQGRTIPLNRINGVDFEIGVIDRMFGCGTLVVTDASERGQVELSDIPRVEEVQLKVAAELHRLTGYGEGAARSDDGV